MMAMSSCVESLLFGTQAEPYASPSCLRPREGSRPASVRWSSPIDLAPAPRTPLLSRRVGGFRDPSCLYIPVPHHPCSCSALDRSRTICPYRFGAAVKLSCLLSCPLNPPFLVLVAVSPEQRGNAHPPWEGQASSFQRYPRLRPILGLGLPDTRPPASSLPRWRCDGGHPGPCQVLWRKLPGFRVWSRVGLILEKRREDFAAEYTSMPPVLLFLTWLFIEQSATKEGFNPNDLSNIPPYISSI